MNLLQVTLISLLGYLTYIHTPFLGRRPDRLVLHRQTAGLRRCLSV